MKRPTDTKDVNFYPTVQSMTLYWEMQVIDCWRCIYLIQMFICEINYRPAENSLVQMTSLNTLHGFQSIMYT
jgi:hypothetical protein